MAYLAVLLSVVLGACGQIFIKMGASGLSAATTSGLLKFALNPYLISGMALYGLSMLSWIYALTRVPLSTAYPMVSLGYILVLAASNYFFHEPIGAWKIAGVLFIVIGVAMISRN